MVVSRSRSLVGSWVVLKLVVSELVGYLQLVIINGDWRGISTFDREFIDRGESGR